MYIYYSFINCYSFVANRFWNELEWTMWSRICQRCIGITVACRRDLPSSCTLRKHRADTPTMDCTCIACAVPKRTADPASGAQSARAGRRWIDPSPSATWTDPLLVRTTRWTSRSRPRLASNRWNATRARLELWNDPATLPPPPPMTISSPPMISTPPELFGWAFAEEESISTRQVVFCIGIISKDSFHCLVITKCFLFGFSFCNSGRR